MELVKENIQCEKKLGEDTQNSVVKEEYVIPDTEPDVYKVLSLDAKPYIASKEVMQNKVYAQGMIKYDVLYMAKVDDRIQVCSVSYTNEFSSYFDIAGTDGSMDCSCECTIEHMECKIINERKIGIEGIVMLKSTVYNNSEFEIVRDIENDEDVQLLRKSVLVDKIIGKIEGDLVAKCNIQIPMDKPEIGRILKCDVFVHKEDVNVYEDKIEVECFALFKVLYRSTDDTELCFVQSDVLVTKELLCEGVDSFMEQITEFTVEGIEYNIKEDDLGEYRTIDVEALIKSLSKIMSKREVDTIEDVYSPSTLLEMEKKNYKLNVMVGSKFTETIVKENIEVNLSSGKLSKILMSNGDICITDQKLVEGKVVVEGLITAKVLYAKESALGDVEMACEEIPFTCGVDVAGSKIDMQSNVKAHIETLESSVEANTIAIKVLVKVCATVYYMDSKEFIVDVMPAEGEVVSKKASLTIYVVQSGDCLWKIAKRYFTTIEALATVNEIDEGTELLSGNKLIIPGRAII